jgi:hypothetical protein
MRVETCNDPDGGSVDDRARIRLQLRLLLVIWRREVRRIAEGRLPVGDRAARQAELRVRARNVLASSAEQIRAVGDHPSDLERLDRARAEIDADGEET